MEHLAFPPIPAYSRTIWIDVNNWNHYKCMRLDSQKKKTEGFSKFLQCYVLSTGVLSEINSFRALFLAKKIHKKGNTSIAHTNHFRQCQCMRMSAVWRCLSHQWTWQAPIRCFARRAILAPWHIKHILLHQPTTIIHELSHWWLSHWQWLFHRQ